jgi:hypothetical protein
MPGPAFRAACHAAEAAPTFFLFFVQSTTSRNQPRYGWLRSLFSIFGFGKHQSVTQDAASILAAVRAAEPIGHTRVDRAGTQRWQTRHGGSIEHEDVALWPWRYYSTRIFFCRHHSINTSSNCHGNAR